MEKYRINSLVPGSGRSRRVTFDATQEMHKKIHQAARDAGMRVPAYVKKLVSKAIEAKTKKTKP